MDSSANPFSGLEILGFPPPAAPPPTPSPGPRPPVLPPFGPPEGPPSPMIALVLASSTRQVWLRLAGVDPTFWHGPAATAFRAHRDAVVRAHAGLPCELEALAGLLRAHADELSAHRRALSGEQVSCR